MGKFGEDMIVDYLRKINLKAEKIREGDEKTPDFEVNNMEGKRIFYLEEKTIDRDIFLDEAEPGLVIEGNDPSENSLESKFRTAAKQFRSINQKHQFPNILAFVNHNEMINIHDLYITLTGTAITEEGEYIVLKRVGRLKEDLKDIDLCLWFEKDGQLVNKLWIADDGDHCNTLKSIFS